MKTAMFTALLISAFIHSPANAEQPLVQVADAREILNDSSAVDESKPDSHVFQNPEANYTNPTDQAWEGVTYILESETSSSSHEVPYSHHGFE